MRLPGFLRRNDRRDESETRGVIATAAVKAEAMTLVGDLRQTLQALDRVLRDEGRIEENGPHGPKE